MILHMNQMVLYLLHSASDRSEKKLITDQQLHINDVIDYAR